MSKVNDKMKRENKNNNSLYQEKGKKITQKRGKNKWATAETSDSEY